MHLLYREDSGEQQGRHEWVGILLRHGCGTSAKQQAVLEAKRRYAKVCILIRRFRTFWFPFMGGEWLSESRLAQTKDLHLCFGVDSII